MASELLFWEGRFRDRCLEVPDEALDAYFDGWIQFDPIIYGFQVFEYAGDSEEGIPKNTIKCSQIKPVKNKPKDRYFSFKYTEGTYFEGTTEPIFEMTYQGSRQNALALRECIKEKCL
uniref:Phage ABA sandwich domain-containing protein n=1 Tax=Acrobeloides nanus TaxID=290746 RepID=A0A914DB35_9BILA